MVVRIRTQRSDKASAGRAERPFRGRPHNSLAGIGRAWRSLSRRLPELRDDLAWYATAQGDRARLLVSRLATRAMFGVFLLIAAAALFAISAAFVIGGAAGGVTAALGGNSWLANLITGSVALIALFGGIALVVGAKRRKRFARLERRYRRHQTPQAPASANGGDRVA